MQIDVIAQVDRSRQPTTLGNNNTTAALLGTILNRRADSLSCHHLAAFLCAVVANIKDHIGKGGRYGCFKRLEIFHTFFSISNINQSFAKYSRYPT